MGCYYTIKPDSAAEGATTNLSNLLEAGPAIDVIGNMVISGHQRIKDTIRQERGLIVIIPLGFLEKSEDKGYRNSECNGRKKEREPTCIPVGIYVHQE